MSSFEERAEARKKRQEEISALANEMMNTLPTYKPVSKPSTRELVAELRTERKSGNDDFPTIADDVDENEDEYSDDEDEVDARIENDMEMMQSNSEQSTNSGQGLELDEIAFSKKIPISHKVDLGHAVAGGASDGSIHIWNIHNKKTFSRPDTVHRHSTPPCADSPITRLLFSEDGAALAARCEEGSICLWDLKSKKATAPSKILRNIPNVYSYSSMTFSPDGQFMVCGTSPLRERDRIKSSAKATAHEDADPGEDSKSLLCFFDLSANSSTKQGVSQVTSTGSAATSGKPLGPGPVTEFLDACIRIAVADRASAIAVRTSAGHTCVYFDPRLSVRGAMLTASRAPKRAKDPSDYAVVGQIYLPNALPLYR
eukprot:gene2217-2649_t